MTEEEIIARCSDLFIRNYVINRDNDGYYIDVNTDVDISLGDLRYGFNNKLSYIPIRFGEVRGYFSCENNVLCNWINSPRIVNGFLDCSDNKLSNFIDSPKIIRGDFAAMNNNFIDIYDFPKVDGYINITGNPVNALVIRFIDREDKNNWIEFFNDCDIIRDDHIIWDRLVFFYDYLDIAIDERMEYHIRKYYEIIR
jgi:hypothetical protein